METELSRRLSTGAEGKCSFQQNYDKIMNGSEDEKLREIKARLEDELLKAIDEVALLKEGKITDDKKLKLM